jgi:TPR repeat protein
MEGSDGVPKNVTKARYYFQLAAESGVGKVLLDASSLFRLSRFDFHCFQQQDCLTMRYAVSDASSVQLSRSLLTPLWSVVMNGWGGEPQCLPSAKMLKVAFESGESSQNFPFSGYIAFDNYAAGQYDVACRQYAALATLGRGSALENLAFLIEQGYCEEAIDWKRAGLPAAQSSQPASPASAVSIGGNGEVEDVFVESMPILEPVAHSLPDLRNMYMLELYQRASFCTEGHARRRVGDCYRDGWQGACSVNLTAAVEWYTSAARIQDGQAAFHLALLSLSHSGGNLTEAWSYLLAAEAIDELGEGASPVYPFITLSL